MKIILDGIRFPEGPAFDRDQNIWIVEKDAGNLIFVRKGMAHRYAVGGAPNGIAIDERGLIWFCDSLQNSIRTFDPNTGATDTIVSKINGMALKMPNDLAFDQHKNLLFTCPGSRLDDGSGYICCLDSAGNLTIVHQGIYYPNGLAFSPDFQTLYIAETGTHFIWKTQWDPVFKRVGNIKKWLNVGGPIGPDGMAVDVEGNLYIAVYGAGNISKINPNTERIEKIAIEGQKPTNCALSRTKGVGLIVTEAEKGRLIQIAVEATGIV